MRIPRGALLLCLLLALVVHSSARVAAINEDEVKAEALKYKNKHKNDYQPPADDDTYAIGLWGDLPYSVLQVQSGTPNIITDMNSQNLAFTIYDGDWKAGSPANTSGTTAILNCSDALYTQQIVGYFASLKAPAAYAPGDNEWTDCDRSNAFGKAYNSLNRLSFLRSLFFNNNPYTLGQQKLLQEVQTDMCLGWVAGTDPFNTSAAVPTVPQQCSENRRWTYKGVTYATINQVGSCNNRCEQFPNEAEYNARNAANIKWIKEAFAKAKERNSAAVMIVAQADPGWDLSGFQDGPKRDPLTLKLQNPNITDGFFDFMTTLREEVINFKKPVAYIHGDSHYFVIDKPLLKENGYRLVNFTRVMTFGDNAANGNNDMNWVKVDVDPRSRQVFTFIPMIVRANNPDQAARRRRM